jgi:peptide/nickel transport system substrate-binding protein
MRNVLISLLAASVALGGATAAFAQSPRAGGTLVVASDGDPDTLDCHAGVSSKVLHRLAPSYSTLIRISEKNYPQIEGDIAREWKVSDDGLTYTFTLNEGVTFHDGSPLTAADVKATLDRIRAPGEGVVSQRKSLFVDVASVEAPDAGTIVVKLSQPNAAMLTYLANPWNCIYSEAMLKADADYPTKKVMGSGPFKFVSFQAGGTWRAEKFDGYFKDGLPHLDAIEIPILAGPALVNAFVAGQIHADFRGMTPGDRDRVMAARGDGVTLFESASPGMQMFTFNGKRAPFDDVRVRKALTLAVDRWAGAKALEKLLFFNNVGGAMRPGSEWARSEEELAKLPGWGKDIEAARAEARALLKEAGQENLKVTFTNFGPFVPFGVYLIDQWTKIGVSAEQQVLAPPQFFANRSQRNFDVILDAHQAYVDDPSLDLAVYQSASRNPLNLSGLEAPEIDALFEAQAREFDPAKRKAIAQEIEAKAMDMAITNPLLWAQRIIIIDKKVQGFDMSPSSLIGRDMAELWLSE